MGMTAGGINLLLDEAKRVRFSGRVVTLGRLHVYNTAEEVKAFAAQRGVSLVETDLILHRAPELAKKGYLSDESLFKMLGFDVLHRLDYCDYEDVEETLDLNSVSTPEHLLNQYDVVIDSGTIEHVFHLPNCLAHLERLAKPGGRIVHLSPTSNTANHGFYSLSPTLFVDYYGQRGHEVSKVYLCQLPRSGFERKRWNVYNYLERTRNWLPLGRLDASIYLTFAVITAATHALSEVIPQQSFYLETWDETASATGLEEPLNTKAGKLLSLARGIPFIEPMSKLLISRWRAFRNQRVEKCHGKVPFPFVGRF